MAVHVLPQDLLIEIFTRLPAKSVGRFRGLSKSWRSHLSTPQFIKSHLNRRIHEENIIFMSLSHSLHLLSPLFKTDAISKKVELPNTWSAVVGSCNGLVLLMNDTDEMFLVNPITSEQVNIPDPPLALKKNESFRMHGFGYDNSSDDYKIVMLCLYNIVDERDRGYRDTFVHVYSLRWGLWKELNISPYDHTCSLHSTGVFVNGAIHWLAMSRELGYRSVIAAFDLAREVFIEIPAPDNVDEVNFVFNNLVVLRGCVCMVDNIQSDIIVDFWIMKDYGLKESWTRFSVDTSEWTSFGFKPLCFNGNEKVVVVSEEGSLLVYNLKDGTPKDLVVDGVPASFLDVVAFKDSLVSPSYHVSFT